MLNAISGASFTLFLALTGAIGQNTKSRCDGFSIPATSISCGREIGFARAFVGGEDVVHIVKSDKRKTPYMEVKASNLLISYSFDKHGRIIDRKVWPEDRTTSVQARCSAML